MVQSLLSVKTEDFEKASQVIAIIQKEYFKSYTVADLASIVGTNRFTLNSAFRKITGLPVKEYVRQYKIDQAKHLLETTHLPIEMIAGRVGLHRTNLERGFKKRYAQTPIAWRRNYQ
jgi:AraC-like DNA-binding protein